MSQPPHRPSDAAALATAYKNSLPTDGTVESFPWTMIGAAYEAGHAAALASEQVTALVEALELVSKSEYFASGELTHDAQLATEALARWREGRG